MEPEPGLTYVGGENAPNLLPAGYTPLAYHNVWDPRLVEPASDNIRYAATLNLPQLAPEAVKPGKCIIIGSAPSVLKNIGKIRKLAKDPKNAIFVVNYAHPLLIKKGIAPTGAVLFEIEKRSYDCLESPHSNCTYYICSICDPNTFDSLKDNKRVVWHCHSDQEPHRNALKESFGQHLMVGGGFTTFLRTLNVTYILGYRDYELFGVDSSFPGKKSHFFGTPKYGGDVMKVVIGFQDGSQHEFSTKSYLVRQADEFRQYCEAHHHLFKMKVHGNGLLPLIHQKLQPQFYEG